MPNRRSEKTTGPSQRQLRVGELVRHALAEMLARGDIHDDVLASHVVTIPEVRMSPDLRLASIYVMPLGGKDVKPVLAALERNKKYIRGEIAHEVNLKFAPDIRFMADESFDEALRIDQILRSPKVAQDLKKD
jgi:ribosome-binding factor A